LPVIGQLAVTAEALVATDPIVRRGLRLRLVGDQPYGGVLSHALSLNERAAAASAFVLVQLSIQRLEAQQTAALGSAAAA
jgi:hypothetical protein